MGGNEVAAARVAMANISPGATQAAQESTEMVVMTGSLMQCDGRMMLVKDRSVNYIYMNKSIYKKERCD